jgi:beta-1,3-galactosyltransferase 1
MDMNSKVQTGIEEESGIFRDILQGDFTDTYRNLTHKGVMGFKWITERCRNAKMIMKVDDDFVVNMFVYFQKLNGPLKHINVYCERMEGKIQRKNESKWFVSNDHFRGETHYKEYCEGKFVSMTNDFIPALYESAIKTPFFPYDDVSLFGYAMHNIPGLKYRSETKSMARERDVGMKCLNEKKNKCDIFVIASDSAENISKTWSIVLKHFN